MDNKLKNFLVTKNVNIRIALKKITLGGKKAIVVVDKEKKLLGVLSDGDVRNAIIDGKSLNDKIDTIYQKKSYFVSESFIKDIDLKQIFIKKSYSLIPIVNDDKIVTKILFWEDVFRSKRKAANKKLKAEVIIMAGGEGKRLKPISDIFPKPLIPINGKPMIVHVMDGFSKFKVKNIYISVNYKSSMIKTYFKDVKTKFNIKYINEKKPLGTIGAVRQIINNVKSHFILTNCDVLVDIDYANLEKFHFTRKNDITVVVTSKEYALPYGNCIVDNQGNLKNIEEKPVYNFLINSGIYLINKKAINLIPANRKYDTDKFLIKAIKNDYKIGIYPISPDKWSDIGKWTDFQKASKY